MIRRIAFWIGTGFGLGYSPIAPGTAGALLGVPLAWWINHSFAVPGQMFASLVCIAIAIPVSQVVEDQLQSKDPHPCVADEYFTFPLCMIGLPVIGQPGGWEMTAVAFATHRAFDIFKLWPAYSLQRLHGGLGIVIDDVFASLYALAANHLIYWLARHFIWQ